MPWNGAPEPTIKNFLVNTSWRGSRVHHNTELWTQLTENRWNSSGIFPRIHYIAGRPRSPKNSWTKWANPNTSKDELSSCRCSMTSYGELKTMKRNVLLIPHLSLFAKRFPAGRWSFLGPGSETGWYSTYKGRPGGEWDKVAELMMIKFGESRQAVFRATSPFSRGTLKSKRGGILSMHFCADGDTIDFFRTIISVNQFSTYGAVTDLCEEYSNCQTRTGRPFFFAEQTDPLFAPADLLITKPTPSIEITAQENIAEAHGTSGKASTTRPILEDLYWCRIPEKSWSRTILHDKTCWRVLTICRTSNMSWICLPRDEK